VAHAASGRRRTEDGALAEQSAGTGAVFKHSVCRWPFRSFTLDELARTARELGIASVELLEPDEWAIVRQHGIGCAMGYATVPDPGSRLTRGFNRAEHHEWLIPAYERAIPLAAAAGVPNLICFSGSRGGQTDEEGLATCARGLDKLMPAAKRHGITLCMELLNSRVDHPDYQCDRTAWGVDLVKRLGSDRFRLLYDIYHMQIMEGDVIRTIRDNHRAIAHFHTAGVPGRHEIDGTQELNYAAIMRAIAETGFTGYVAQEFMPTREPRGALAEAIRICSL
jgi:hydroxypyruvate isomerase